MPELIPTKSKTNLVMAKPIHIPKPLPQRMLELIQSLLVLRDCIEQVRKGNLHHFIPIYGQLRALLAEKRKNNKPLLIDLANILRQSLDIWCMGPAGPEAIPVPKEWKANLVLNISGFPISLHQQLPGQKLITIDKFLDHKILYYDKQYYKTSDVITFFANQAGGAHYATNIKKDFAQILTVNLNGQPILVNFLLQIAEVTYELGLRLLKRLNDIEVHIAAIIAEQEIKSNKFLFDTKYPNTPIRATILVRQDRSIAFVVSGLNGASVQVATNRLIDFSKPHYFVFLHQIDEKLSTNMQILVDGELFGQVRIPVPIFFVNELRAHETYHNRSFEDESAGIRWAMFSLAVTDPEGSVTERSQIFVYFSNLLKDEGKSGVVYLQGSYSHAEPGKTDQKLSGDFFWSTLGRVAAGDWNKPQKGGNSKSPSHAPQET